jgi:hypothetical protein
VQHQLKRRHTINHKLTGILVLGNLWRENSQIFINSAKPWLAPALGWTSQEYTSIWNAAHEEMNETKAFINCFVAWGRNPEDGSGEINWDDCTTPGWSDA